RFLEQHIALNDLRNVELIKKAVGSSSGTAQFETGASLCAGRISTDGLEAVEVIRGDDETLFGRLPFPAVIKMDIEGGEVAALEGMPETLARARVVFVATHNAEARQFLEKLGGFREFETNEFVRGI